MEDVHGITEGIHQKDKVGLEEKKLVDETPHNYYS